MPISKEEKERIERDLDKVIKDRQDGKLPLVMRGSVEYIPNTEEIPRTVSCQESLDWIDFGEDDFILNGATIGLDNIKKAFPDDPAKRNMARAMFLADYISSVSFFCNQLNLSHNRVKVVTVSTREMGDDLQEHALDKVSQVITRVNAEDKELIERWNARLAQEPPVLGKLDGKWEAV